MNEHELFKAAIKLTGDQRNAFLDAAWEKAPELRSQVEALLQAHDEPGGIIPKRIDREPDATVLSAHNAAPGMILGGRYKLLENIGEGGMGSVWLAEQTQPVKRRVAIKLVKAGMDSRQVLARFEAERQALALMDHANIAKVFDGGMTEQGRPFFVMEYVKGVPFTEYCDQARLSLNDRLQLFIPVCQAVQHAHHKGIVHRDLKPSNILICLYDGKPIPKVIDFGLAKALHQSLTEQTLHTGHGVMVGTPLYMSPEQAEHNNLDVDTRTDIYSLGVVLYELLTGTTPLEKQQLQEAVYNEILRLIKEVEPPRPSTRLSGSTSLAGIAAQRGLDPRQLCRFLVGDLDWIVMKALEKERTRRYETANGLARDVERFLNEEPVEARPPGTAYRFRKFIRKHRLQVIAAGAIACALIIGMIGTSWGLFRAWAAENRTIAALGEVTKERDAKEVERRNADEARLRAEEAENLVLTSYRENTDDVIEQLIGSKDQIGPQERAYLERTLERWQALANREGNDEQSRVIRTEGYFRVAALWQKLGQNERARVAFDLARSIRRELVQQFPDVPEYQYSLAIIHNSLGVFLSDLGEEAPARMEYASARDIQRKLVQQFPEVPKYQYDLAQSHSNLGILFSDLGDNAAARVEYEAAQGIRRKLVQQFPAVPEYQYSLAVSHNSLGVLLAEHGDEAAARVEYEAAKDVERKLVQQFPTVPRYQSLLAAGHVNLGRLLAAQGDHGAARAEYEAAKDVQRKLVQQFPAIPEYQHALAKSHGSLGDLYHDQGDQSAAQVEYEAARDIFRTLVQQFPTVPEYQYVLATSHGSFGNVLRAQADLAAAQVEYEAARDIFRKLVQQFPTIQKYRLVLAITSFNYGIVLSEHPEGAGESLPWFTQAIEVLTPVVEQDPGGAMARTVLLESYEQRAAAHVSLQQYAESLPDWDQSITLSPDSDQRRLRAKRADARLRAGHVAAAVAEVDELILLAEAGGESATVWSAMQWYNFACLYSVASSQLPEQQAAYAIRAMELLKKAVDAGYNTAKAAEHMAKDTDLDPLRDRDDFQQLIQSLPKPPDTPPATPPSPPSAPPESQR